MQPAISEYYVRDDGGIRLFIGGISPDASPGDLSLLAGTEECLISEAGPVQGSVPVKTILMLDNSKSVKDFEGLRELLRLLVSNHMENEEFSLAVFDTGLEIISADSGVFTNDYDHLLSLLDSVSQADRNTAVDNALMQALSYVTDDGSLYRIILASDGGDAVNSGLVTLQEVDSCLQEKPVILHTIGVQWNSSAANGLDGMAYLGRKYGTFHTYEAGSSGVILSDINEDSSIWYADAFISPSLQDGSIRSLKAEYLSADNSFTVSRDVRMPQSLLPVPTATPSPLPTPSPEPTPVPALQPVVTEIPEVLSTQSAMDFLGNIMPRSSYLLAGGAVLLTAAAILAAVLLMRRKKQRAANENIEPEELPDHEETEFYVEREAADEEDSYETQMMFAHPPEESVPELCLKDVKDPSRVLKSAIDGGITVGSSRNYSDIVIEGDPTVSRKHAAFTLEGGKLCVEDLGSTNGTWMNRNRADRRTEVTNGDLVRCGDSEFIVSF